jgi:hypothetical protein
MEEFNAAKFPRSFDALDDGTRKKLIKWHGKTYAEDFITDFHVMAALTDGMFLTCAPSLTGLPARP